MSTIMKRFGAAILSLTFIFAAASQTNAQSWRRHHNGDLPGGQKAAIIGGSAAVGAVIGALTGGTKGAIIGGAIGAGAGTAGVLIKDSTNDDDRYRGYRGYRDYRYYPEYRNYRDYRPYDRTFYRSDEWRTQSWGDRDRDRDGDHDRDRRWRR